MKAFLTFLFLSSTCFPDDYKPITYGNITLSSEEIKIEVDKARASRQVYLDRKQRIDDSNTPTKQYIDQYKRMVNMQRDRYYKQQELARTEIPVYYYPVYYRPYSYPTPIRRYYHLAP